MRAAEGWKRVCVFAGSNVGKNGEFTQAAKTLGRLLAEQGLTLVYGGGSTGLMGVIADSVLENGGEVIGVIPEFLATRELLHTRLTETIITADMHSRKARMATLSDAFIAMPGGLGTFEEFFEALTWAQLGVHRKPIGLLNVGGFYDPVLELIDHSISSGFVRQEHRDLLEADALPDLLLRKMSQKQMPDLPKWTDLSEL